MQLFSATPEKFIPQYGSYSAYGMSQGKLRPINPEIFQVVEGKVLLFENAESRDQFSKDNTGHLVKADTNWAKFATKYPNGKVRYGA